MTLARILFVTVLVAAVCGGTVFLRQAMAIESRRIQQLHGRQVALEQQLWSRQMELARLRIPQKIRQRVEDLDLSLELPKIERRAAKADTRGRGIVGTHD